MTNEELINEIHADYSSVCKKADHLLPKVRRRALRLRKKHLNSIYEYISPKKNKWIIIEYYKIGV